MTPTAEPYAPFVTSADVTAGLGLAISESTPTRLLRSVDGGRSWQLRPFPFACAQACGEVRVLDGRHAFLFGSAFAETSDAGNTWTVDPVRVSSLVPRAAPYESLRIRDCTDHTGGLLQQETVDHLWRDLHTPGSGRECPYLLAAGAIVVLIKGSTFFVSDDNALHWHSLASPCQPGRTLGPAAIDPDGDIFTLCLGSLDTRGTTPVQSAALDVSHRGGSWVRNAEVTLSEVWALVALDATHLIADTGGPHVFTHSITTDGGRSWDDQRVPWSGPDVNFVLPWHGPGTPAYVFNADRLSSSPDLGTTWPTCYLVLPDSQRCRA